jgi:hypothetical protein
VETAARMPLSLVVIDVLCDWQRREQARRWRYGGLNISD